MRSINRVAVLFLISLFFYNIQSQPTDSLVERFQVKYAQVLSKILEQPENKIFDIGNTTSDGYTEYKGIGFYKIHQDNKNWNKARKSCMSEGAHLAIINSKDEEDAIIHLFRSLSDDRGPMLGWFWFGMHRYYDENEWVTVKGDSVNYIHWFNNEEDPGDEEDKCGSLKVLKSGHGMQSWWCDARDWYVCELNSSDIV